MKIHVLSDLHLEEYPCEIEDSGADIVVLAGDIGIGAGGVQWAKEQFDIPVLYVPGNHEFHGTQYTMDEVVAHMKEAATGSNVQVLDNDVVETCGARFLGTTLWTDLKKYDCEVLECDLERIKVDAAESFTTDVAQALFERNVAWLECELAKPFDGPTVVISHHAPSEESTHQRFRNNPFNPCFSTNVEHLMGSKVQLWIHGHTHNAFDYFKHGTRVVCNPRGYRSAFGGPRGGWENYEFDLGLTVNI